MNLAVHLRACRAQEACGHPQNSRSREDVVYVRENVSPTRADPKPAETSKAQAKLKFGDGDVAGAGAEGDQSDEAAGGGADDGKVVGLGVNGEKNVITGSESELDGLFANGDGAADVALFDLHWNHVAGGGIGNVEGGFLGDEFGGGGSHA